MATQTYVDGVTLTAAAELNEFDTTAYAHLTGTAGTNTITATGPANFTYAAGRMVRFIASGTNTAATTLNITPSGASALGAKNVFYGGAACAGGEIISGVPTVAIYDGTQFNVIGGFHSKITASLGGDVALNNTGTFFDGPSIAQGTVGTWFVSGTVTLQDTAGAAAFQVKLYDGTTTIVSARADTAAASGITSVTVSGYIASPAGNIRIAVKDITSTSGKIIFNTTGLSKDSSISAIRIA